MFWVERQECDSVFDYFFDRKILEYDVAIFNDIVQQNRGNDIVIVDPHCRRLASH